MFISDNEVEIHSRMEIEKSLRALMEEKKELATNLIAEERGRKSAEVGLKNAQNQARISAESSISPR